MRYDLEVICLNKEEEYRFVWYVGAITDLAISMTNIFCICPFHFSVGFTFQLSIKVTLSLLNIV